MKFPQIAVILAGGKGTRLGLKDIPKPMVDICGKPLLERQIDWLRREGVREVYFLINHLAEVVENHFGDGSQFGVRVHYVVESVPLGTAGALKQLEAMIQQDFWVVYGDLVCDVDLFHIAKFHEDKNSDLTLVVHPNDHPYDSDLVEVDEQLKVSRFLTKPHPPGLLYRNLVNAAVYLATPKIFSFLEKDLVADLARDIFPVAIEKINVFAYNSTEYLKDMGTPDRLEKVRKDWLSGKVERMKRVLSRPAVFLDRDGTICEYVPELHKLEDFKLRPGAGEAIRLLNQAGYLVFVVTNQPMIAKGLISFAGLSEVHKKMETLLGEEKAWLDHVYFCPHHPDRGFVGERLELKIDCDCRKPRTGMLEQAAGSFKIDLNRSFMVGDTWRDIECGQRFGLKTVGLNRGAGYPYADKKPYEPLVVFDELLPAIQWILEEGQK